MESYKKVISTFLRENQRRQQLIFWLFNRYLINNIGITPRFFANGSGSQGIGKNKKTNRFTVSYLIKISLKYKEKSWLSNTIVPFVKDECGSMMLFPGFKALLVGNAMRAAGKKQPTQLVDLLVGQSDKRNQEND